MANGLVPDIGAQVGRGLKFLGGVRGLQAQEAQQQLAQQQLQSQLAQQAQMRGLEGRVLGGLNPVQPLEGQGPRIAPEQQVAEGLKAQAELAVRFPDRFKQISENLGLITQQQKDEAAQFASEGIRLLQSGDQQGFQQLQKQRVSNLAAQGRNPVDTQSLSEMTPEQQMQALQATLVSTLPPEKQLELSRGKTGLASAKTEILPGGSVIQALPSGEVQVRDPQGNIVTGQQRQQVLDEAREFQLELRREKSAINVQEEAQKAAAKAGVKLATEPEIQSAVTEAVSEVKATQKALGEQRSNAVALRTYETAMKGLADALSGTDTGPFSGLTPALTSNQQIADGAVAAMAPVLKGLFRTAGEGTFTDKDQELLLKMVPTRTDTPASRKSKIQNIDAIVRAKLGQASDVPEPPQQTSAPAPAQQQPVIRFDRQGRRIE